MKKIICIFVLLILPVVGFAADEKFVACGPGYVLASASKIDGITAAECQKLWCRDLEAAKVMGTNDRAASGYKSTSSPIELCDASGACIECFGDRQWCSGEAAGIWNPEYGAYTRLGGDTATYESYQKGSCFAWRLEQPDCEEGTVAILRNNEWTCATSTGNTTGVSRESAIRRTGGSIRRLTPIR